MGGELFCLYETRKTERNRSWSSAGQDTVYGVCKANETGVVNLREFRLDEVFIYLLGACDSRSSIVLYMHVPICIVPFFFLLA